MILEDFLQSSSMGAFYHLNSMVREYCSLPEHDQSCVPIRDLIVGHREFSGVCTFWSMLNDDFRTELLATGYLKPKPTITFYPCPTPLTSYNCIFLSDLSVTSICFSPGKSTGHWESSAMQLWYLMHHPEIVLQIGNKRTHTLEWYREHYSQSSLWQERRRRIFNVLESVL
jgi:hypothetical protein